MSGGQRIQLQRDTILSMPRRTLNGERATPIILTIGKSFFRKNENIAEETREKDEEGSMTFSQSILSRS